MAKRGVFFTLVLISVQISIEVLASSCETGSDSCGARPRSALLQLDSHKSASTATQMHESLARQVPAQKGMARSLLPKALFDLGVQLLSTEDVLDDVVANTVLVRYSYAGVPVSLRQVTGDSGSTSDVYGLDSLNTLAPNPEGMMTMLDLGGNMGVVTIAAFKKVPTKMRAIVVEPVPSTYFLLRWNMFLNGIPQLTREQFQNSPRTPGVLALNNGVASIDNKTSGLCYKPPYTMNAKICDCNAQAAAPLQAGVQVEQCATMTSRTFGSLLEMFGEHPLTFMKMDCEGCEVDVVPHLKNLTTSGYKLGRFSGEFHASPNDFEDYACTFEGGKWFVHVCNVAGPGTSGPTAKFNTYDLTARCAEGASRQQCTA